jgi:glycosyltransferase involved in cell wall biosynthesis
MSLALGVTQIIPILGGIYQIDRIDLAGRLALGFAQWPFLLFLINLCLFRRPGRAWNKRPLPKVSVLIPARNEERTIAKALASVRASRGVEMEIIVMDDGSTDRTAQIVHDAANEDPRIRLVTAPDLPEGWNGKQHACWALAGMAKHPVFCFIDADVRLETEAIYRMASEINAVDGRSPERAMVSGFPRQETRTFFERLLLPLIHFVLLSYLPLAGERWLRSAAFAVGCGQFMMVRREPYFKSGGHEAIRQSMHDGLLLPKLFRRQGYRTGVYDLTRDAVCRMYYGAADVWRGLGKNATEGMATPLRLPVFTVLLLGGQVAPFLILGMAIPRGNVFVAAMSILAILFGYAASAICAWRFKQHWLGILLHPLGVLMLVALQWLALLRKLFGGKATWKGREYEAG